MIELKFIVIHMYTDNSAYKCWHFQSYIKTSRNLILDEHMFSINHVSGRGVQ